VYKPNKPVYLYIWVYGYSYILCVCVSEGKVGNRCRFRRQMANTGSDVPDVSCMYMYVCVCVCMCVYTQRSRLMEREYMYVCIHTHAYTTYTLSRSIKLAELRTARIALCRMMNIGAGGGLFHANANALPPTQTQTHCRRQGATVGVVTLM
jgi:hypothetical protein